MHVPDADALDRLVELRDTHTMASRFMDAANRSRVPALQREATDVLRDASLRLLAAAAPHYPSVDVFSPTGMREVLAHLAAARPELTDEVATEPLD